MVRIGPYVCGEYYFGGIPLWLREVDDVQCFRCSDPVWEREAARFVGEVVAQLSGAKLLWDQGGPVVMLQIENEYNGPDSAYLSWTVQMAQNLTLSLGSQVPWNLCHDQPKCAAVNAARLPGYPEVLCTINGFWMDDWDNNNAQPCPKWFSDQHALNPGQPTMWTEDQGWFDQWGVAKRVRHSSDQIYGVARALAFGASYHNFYMVTGGSNFGRQAGGEVVTAYAPDTVIDYLLLRHQPRFDGYAAFFHAVLKVSRVLLNAPIAQGVPLMPLSSSSSSPSSSFSSTASPLVLSATTCYQYNPPSQQWTLQDFPGPGALNSGTDASQCVDAGAPGPVGGVQLVPCAAGAASQRWVFNQSAGYFASSSGDLPCRSPHAPTGSKCHMCLDLASNGSVDLWDCKSGDSNQHWDWVVPSSSRSAPALSSAAPGETQAQTATIRPHATANCLTASGPTPGPANRTGVEVHEYAGAPGEVVAFLSNFQDVGSPAVAVTYRGSTLWLASHSVLLLHVETSSAYRSGANQQLAAGDAVSLL